MKKSVLIGVLLTLFFSSYAWQPPKMQCLKLMNNNQRIQMAWSCSDCIHFKIYYFYVNGVLCDSLTGYNSATQSYTLCDYGALEINNIPIATDYQCFIKAVDSNGIACYSDTIRSINLNVTPQANNTLAYLEWESPTSNLDANWAPTFGIYKKRAFEADFPPTPFAMVPNTQLHYTDTSDVCDNSISYQVGITNLYGGNYNTCEFRTTIGTVHLMDSTSPAPPILDSVTVTPTNEVMLGFHGTEPYMMAFLIYYISPNGTIPLDTIYGQTFWIDPVINPSFDSRYYRIATMDSCGNVSPLTDEQQCNMMLHLQGTDACNRSATVQWSAYANLINDINHYEVMLSGDNGQNWTNMGSTTSHNFTINNLTINQNYIAYVRVVNNGGTVTASSNRVNILIHADESQDFTYIRSVSVIDNHYLRIKVLTSGDTLPFQTITLQRSEDGTTFENFKTLNYISGVADYVFNDSTVNVSRNTYYYRAFLFNNCEVESAFSNISHNILLRGENNAQNNLLSWPGYDNWDGDVASYFVMRKVENEELFNSVGQLPGGTVNNYTDDISSLYESGSKFVYYIEAQENTNSYGFNETSYSNQITVTQPPAIYIPNAFRPLGANNKVFRPVNSFVSVDQYRFSIFTRTGECIFLTTNPQEGWDGRINGVVAPMNVYVYHLEYKMPDGTMMERTGTVTLVK